MKKILLFVCLIFPLMAKGNGTVFSDKKHLKGKVFFLTYPRCGTNMTLGSLQLLTKRRLRWVEKVKGGMNPHGFNRLKLDLNGNKSAIYRTHGSKFFNGINTYQNKLIVQLRNYKEVGLRCRGDNPKKFLSWMRSSDFRSYMRKISCYERWDPAHRLLITYEDMLTNTEETLARVLDFLGEEGDLVEFMEHRDENFAKILSSYDQQHSKKGMPGSYSKGKDLLYHSKKVPQEVLLKADEYVQKWYPEYWEKHLFCYQTL